MRVSAARLKRKAEVKFRGGDTWAAAKLMRCADRAVDADVARKKRRVERRKEAVKA